MPEVRCTDCHAPYPADELPYCCPFCGGTYDWAGDFPIFDGTQSLRRPGIWRYAESLCLPDSAPVVSLGEGGTPLIEVETGVWGKFESLNPTGSYKDRGSAALVSFLISRGVQSAVEDSSGNAGASFAAYAARGGMGARVFVPEGASGPKRRQIEAYGAELARVPGPRAEAARAVLAEVQAGAVYASHAFMPFGLPGIATMAYEIVEQLGGVPARVIAPVGHGGLLLGLLRGFKALWAAKRIHALPELIGVQAAACAPVVKAYQAGVQHPLEVAQADTVAEGVAVRQPARGAALLQAFGESGGRFVDVAEHEILSAYQALAGRGMHVEPTSALVWAAYAAMRLDRTEPVVLIFSGAGLKYLSST